MCVCICGASVSGTDRWCAFGRTVCPVDAGPGAAWRGGRHELVPAGGAYQCSRCHLPVAPARKGIAGAQRCPAWELTCDDGPVPGSIQWSAQLAHLGPAWKRAHGGIGRAAPVRALPVREERPPTPTVVVPGGRLMAAYREHLIVTGGGRSFCLACGLGLTARNRLGRQPCRGFGQLRATLREALLAGIFDEAIRRAGSRALSLAAGWGRQLERLERPRAPD